jgi:hypothetical protein
MWVSSRKEVQVWSPEGKHEERENGALLRGVEERDARI